MLKCARNTLAGLLLALLCFSSVKADCIVAFHATWCGPCRAMAPVEDKLIKEGYDIRKVDIDLQPELAKRYNVDRIPCFVYIHETAWWSGYEFGRIEGYCTEKQLRRLCVMPGITTIGAAYRSALREILGTPILLDW